MIVNKRFQMNQMMMQFENMQPQLFTVLMIHPQNNISLPCNEVRE